VTPGHPPARPSRGEAIAAGTGGALEAIVCQHLSVARVAEALSVSWHTANNAVPTRDAGC
jgi:hypothetical protein